MIYLGDQRWAPQKAKKVKHNTTETLPVYKVQEENLLPRAVLSPLCHACAHIHTYNKSLEESMDILKEKKQ